MPSEIQKEIEASAELQRLTLTRDGLDSEEKRVKEQSIDCRNRITETTADIEREKTLITDSDIALKNLEEEHNNIQNADFDEKDALDQATKNLKNANLKIFGSLVTSNQEIQVVQNNLVSLNKIKSINIFSKGDDYQILFTSHKKNRKLVEKIGKLTSTKISMIGQVKRHRIVKIYNGNKIIKLFKT